MKLNFGINKSIKEAYAQLPLGSVKAESWLYNQLVMMKNGITGEMEKFPDYYESEWLSSSGENWERGPYYLRGLVALAYVLDDSELKNKAQKWIEAIISSAREGGMFGPRSNEDWWSRMPVLMALRDYYEACENSGNPDERVIPFMSDYFRYQLVNLPKRPLESWARARGGDNMDSVYWLYNRLYDEKNPDESKWLLELAKLLRNQTQDWSRIMNETTVREHVVNTSQALKMPVLYWQQSGDEYDRNAFENALFNISIDHGRIDGLPNSDEAARDNRSTRGSELCGIVEGMLSTEIALRVLREGWIGDRLESLAYNALPSGYSYDYLGHVYYILQNQVMATNGYHEFDCDHGDSSAFGAPCGFDCCFANNHMGWPKFVQSMWMAKGNGGMVAAAYGPCKVTYGDMSFVEATDYPFNDTIVITYTGKEKEFELSLRIPEWCLFPNVSVNGKEYKAENGKFLEINRVWQCGDKCTLHFPMSIKTVDGYNGSLAVTAGPLVYSLPVKENWTLLQSNSARELKVPSNGKMLNREVKPASDWNYAIFEDNLELHRKESVSAHPFTPQGAPVSIKAKAVQLPYWTLDKNIAAVQPYGGANADIKKARDITLVPYGCTRLKITHFPKANGRRLIYSDPEHKTRQGECFTEFSNITLPKASDYDIVIKGSGKGRIVINGVYKSEIEFVEGVARVSSLAKCIEKCEFRFDHIHYNNVRIYTATAYALEIEPVKEFDELVIKEISLTDNSVKVKLNADRSFCDFTLKCGISSGVYDVSVKGFNGDTGVINSLENAKEYYIIAQAYINGHLVRSKEIAVRTLDACREDNENDLMHMIVLNAETAYNTVVLSYNRIRSAKYYEIWYGIESGKYTDRVTDVIFNPYKGSFCFESDSVSFSVDGRQQKYYVCMKGFSENGCVASSEEIEVIFDDCIYK